MQKDLKQEGRAEGPALRLLSERGGFPPGGGGETGQKLPEDRRSGRLPKFLQKTEKIRNFLLTSGGNSSMIIKLAWKGKFCPPSTAMNREIARKR